MAKIFISYRRGDSAGHAGRLYDRLSDHFGPDEVFMDVDAIKPGRNFVDEVRQAVGACDGLVAIIGREWLSISDSTGAPRLNDPADIVSLEIATALERGIRVIPVLVQGAPMPAATDFPESLKQLAQRNAQEISDRTFNSDAQRLIEALEAPEPEPPERDEFVGRQRELAVLTAALDNALLGNGQIVMLAGDPGIGKTRTSRELAAYAEKIGVQVLWGSCYEGDGAPSYWPWIHAIASYIEPLSAERLSAVLGGGDSRLAEIIPSITEKLPDLASSTVLEPEQARFQLFNSVSTFLGNASSSSPILIVLEDLHWADNATLMLLEFVITAISSAPLMLLGTYRDVELGRRHPLSRTLGELVRESSFQRVHLNSFDADEVGQFVESRASISLEASDLELVHGRTGGNPLFLNELMRLQSVKGDADADAWKTGLPEGVRDVIGRRLDRLSEKCNEVLSAASVIGPEFGFNQLQPLLDDVTGDGMLELLEEAL